MASEMGVLEFEEKSITRKWRLQPGKMLLIDLEERPHRVRRGPQGRARHQVSVREWLDRTQVLLKDMPDAKPAAPKPNVSLLDRQQAFGYTQEDLKFLLAPMAQTGQEAIGSMGTDTPVSALSSQSKLLHTYFKQNFAQVTNPPIDPIREELVMSWCRSSALAPTCLT
jgi:glutamate synthase (NADPH/NADH) large chain